MKNKILQILIGIGIVSLMTFFLIKTNSIESGDHNRFSQQLRHLKEMDATLDKDILETRYGLVGTYDQLFEDETEITRLRSDLRSMPGFFNQTKRDNLIAKLDEFGGLQDQKNVLIEEFKSQNAIINNSLRYFPVAAARLVNETGPLKTDRSQVGPLNDLLRDILTFYLLPNTDLEQTIINRIDRLEKSQDQTAAVTGNSDLDITIKHARTIVKLKPDVDHLVSRIVSMPTTDSVEGMIGLYDSYYDASVYRAGIYRLLLYILSVFLVGYIAFIIVKLRKATLAVKATNENLEHRVNDRTTELMWSNIELQRSETNNKALLHALPDAIWRTDGDGFFLDVIPAQADNPIVSADDWQGKTIHDILPPHISRQVIELAGVSLGSGEPQIMDFALGNKDKIQHYECRIVVCGESEILTVVRDVTELKQAVAESQVILETMQGISTTSNLKELLDHIHHSISKFLYAENCFVALYDANTETLDMEFFMDKYDDVPQAGKLGKGLTGYAFRTAEPLMLSKANILQLIGDGEVELVGTPPAVWLGVPLRTPKGVIGVLVVQHYEDDSVYGERDLELLTSVGDQIALAIERKRAEEAVQNSRDYLDQIINAVGDPIFVKNRKHELILVNDAMSKVMGRDRIDLIGKTDAEFLPTGEASVFWEKDELVFESGEENINEEGFTNGAGEARVIVTRKCLYTDKDGEQYIVGVMNDITERKLAEETLREKEAKFRDLFDNAPVAYHELDVNGCFTRVNRTEEQLLGYTEDELRGRHPSEIIVEKVSREATAAKLAGTMPLQAVERTFIRKDGTLVAVLNEDRLILDTDGSVMGIRSTLQDISERKLLEDKLQRGQKLESIGQLAAGIAHEINTPTQYVGDNVRFLKDSFDGYTAVMEKSYQMLEFCRTKDLLPDFVPAMAETIKMADIEYLTEEVPKAFKQALDGVDRISKIVQSMKDFAHPGSNDMRATDLNKAIESTITVASNEWKYVADVVTEYDNDLPLVPCLTGEFNQVILNMIVNAAHAISDVIGDGSNGKGTIRITTKLLPNTAEIRISDSGSGMTETIRKKIFDPFFTTKEVGKGTGQGLAISHTVIVEKHRGTIDVESEVGVGTTFIICMPIGADIT